MEMAKHCSALVYLGAILVLALNSPVAAQANAPPSLSPASAPAPAPHLVNLTDLLTVAGPFHTFLGYLLRTKVMDTFQNQANNTDAGITIFVPTDAAFASLKKPSLANLTEDQLRSLLLYHALPKYYSLAEFKNLSRTNPVATFAGGQFTINVSDASGLIRVDSGWSNPKISSSVIATRPVAVYEIGSVLLPVAMFGAAPPPAPAAAPAPDTAKPSDAALRPPEAPAGPISPPPPGNSALLAARLDIRAPLATGLLLLLLVLL